MEHENFNNLTFELEEENIFLAEDFISISITGDKMEAYISILPPDNDIEINMEMINQVLETNNIKFGVEYKKIHSILKNKTYNEPIKIAMGTQPIDGKDGYLTYHFDTEPSAKPLLLEDGSVDFRNLNIIQNVKEEQLLVTYTPPTEEQDGYFVTGDIIKAKKGKPFLLPKGKKVKISEDGLKLLAERDGNVEIIDGKVCVSNVMVIRGDVDALTGNISFSGDVLITGNVLTGFNVTATGSINVDGFVEASTLKADGNIVLKNGIQGSGKGKITSGGNIATKFIEMSEIYAKGVITTNAIMNSTVESECDIIVSGKRGFIIGGTTKALNKIQATGLGNMSEITTVLEVGFTEESIKKLVSLEQEIKVLSEELKNIEINMNNFKPTVNKIELMRTKIEKSAQYSSDLKEYQRLKDLKEKVDTPRIDVAKIINVGTVLFMKSDVYKVKNPMSSTSFRFGSTNRMVIISYNKN